jgi:hypothetical protein
MARVLRVRCTSWDQVEAFYQRKLRRGRYLSMRVPFTPDKNSELTIGLELPSQLVVAIDGTVLVVAPGDDGDRTGIEINLHGMTPELTARLEALVADGRASERLARPTPPPPMTLPEHIEPSVTPPVEPLDEATAARFLGLEAELRRLRELPAHEVLGVPWDAGPAEVRRAWIALGRRFHPDNVARHGAAALAHVAEELTIHVNRAYDRLRAALVAEGRAAAFGPALHEPRGWLVGFEDVSTGEPAAPDGDDGPAVALAAPRPRSSVRFAAVEGDELTEEGLFGDLELPAAPGGPVEGEAFERQARSRLAAGEHGAAKEVLAAALHLYPKSRRLRALYHVATALEALDAGQTVLATSQLEAALTHDERCHEAATALEELRRGDDADLGKRLFR